MFRKLAVIVPFVALMATACVAPQSTTPTHQEAENEVKQLLLLMDRDQNGKVSRAEFMSFMNAEFDRLDINHDGELDVNELAGLRVMPQRHPGGPGSR